MFFYNKSVEGNWLSVLVAKGLCFLLTIMAAVVLFGINGYAASSHDFSHNHSSQCYNSSGKLSCRLKEGTLVVELTQMGTGWKNRPIELFLVKNQSGELDLAGMSIKALPIGEAGSGVITAKSNSRYTYDVQTNDGRSATLSYTVNNLDMTKPEVAVDYTPKDWTKENIILTITASDARSGLEAKPYSIDGGNSFSSKNSFTVKNNGDYEIVVKDVAGNETRKKIKIDNIDREGPEISYFGPSVEGWHSSDITLNVVAADNMSGLARYPFSYNGGENYTANSTYKISSNGSYKVIVKDALGNTSEKVITVNSIDKDNPIIRGITVNTSDWVKDGVSITVEAYDATSGLDEKAYSFDGGKNFIESNSFLATKNATVSIVVRDKAGNKTADTIKISNVDNKAPEISSVSFGQTKWTNKDYEISVNATDKESGLCVAPYSFDGGKTYSASPNYTVRENTTLVICVKDNAGNITSRECRIENIDKDKPTIDAFSLEDSKWTNAATYLNVSAGDKTSGLASYPFSFNGGDYTSSKRFKVTENGTYVIRVKDNAGNIASSTVTVSCIDRIKPQILEVSKDKNTWTNSYVVIKITAKDDEAGLAKAAYSFDGGKTYSDSNTYVVTQNMELTLAVKDNAGNESYSLIDIRHIDKGQPAVTIEKQTAGWTNKSVRLLAKATDRGSGLCEKAYSWGGKAYSGQSFIDVNENGNYGVKVCDKAGNVGTKSVQVSNIDKSCPIIEKIEKSTNEWTSTGLTISVEARDDESGLEGAAYSFDGGVNYVSTASAYIRKNGSYKICVRDKAGNVSEKNITIANIGKNPSELEQENLEAQLEAEEREAEREEAERERKKLEQELKDKEKKLNEYKEGDESDDKVVSELESELRKTQSDFERQNEKLMMLEEQSKKADENARLLADKVDEAKKSDIIGNVIDSFHKGDEINPVEIDENGELQKVSVKDYVSYEDEEALTDGESDMETSKDDSRGMWLKIGIALVLLGMLMAFSFNYIYVMDGKKIKKLIFVKVKVDNSRIIVNVPAGKLSQDGKYKIFFSIFSRIARKDKPVYVNVEDIENVYTTNEGKSFEFCMP